MHGRRAACAGHGQARGRVGVRAGRAGVQACAGVRVRAGRRAGVCGRAQVSQNGVLTSVLPKWLRRGTPTIPGHPVIMGPPGFHRATHKKRASVNSRQKRLHSEKLCSGGGITATKRSISERSSAM
ncbi:hypothetical protein CRG98_046271 [Punica granatum]|uniref:Uncharacterized protein n=1 Tax=Punica granatum TaxID=22663 RepID=A0A2I0HNR2_PUNGR|nr:hypothetical protein CRG98_046271 [Punica granatum]